jgi:exonuclease V gamma subunit
MKIEIGPYEDNQDRTVDIQIDPYDTWNMDHTLAMIIAPMLKQLKATKHGYPSTLTVEEWDNILGEMIWSFENSASEDMSIAQIADQDRIDRGFQLFGKYYKNLWD